MNRITASADDSFDVITVVSKGVDNSYIVSRGGTKYFLKCMAPYKLHSNNYTEVDVCLRLKHTNLMSALYVMKRDSTFQGLSIIYPYVGCDLISYLKGNPTVTERLSIVRKIVHAVGFLHKNDILHLDIKPDNVMYDGTNPLLTDYGSCRKSVGLSCVLPLNERGTCYVTPEFRPPELSDRDLISTYSWYTDVWSLGLFFFVVLTSARFYPPTVRCNDHTSIKQFVYIYMTTIESRQSYIERVIGEKKLSLVIAQMTELNPLQRPRLETLMLTVGSELRTIPPQPARVCPVISNVPLEAQRGVCDILDLFAKKLPRSPSQCLFLAVDLYVRSCHILKTVMSKKIESDTLSAACIVIALSSTFRCTSSHMTIVREGFRCDSDRLQSCIDETVIRCDGIIHRPYLFDAARNVLHLSHMVKKYMHNLSLYIRADLSAESRDASYAHSSKICCAKDVT